MQEHKTISMRISTDDLDMINEAAECDKRPRSQFLLKAGLDYAARILNERNSVNAQ